jgi:hypothetical protein
MMGKCFRAIDAIVVGVILVVAAGGCGSRPKVPTALVSGTVTVNGKPVKGLEVHFVPVAKIRPAFAMCDEHGRYNAQFLDRQMGVPLGPCVVKLAIYRDAARMHNLLPKEYHENAAENPALTLDIPSQGTTFNCDVKMPGSPKWPSE